eukprot:m.236539 g.236539  ORF g.236539 m.236539 type:complete len:325 (+) comp20647_c0_seq1:36-1010(+)
MAYAITIEDVEAAAQRLKGMAHVTPVLESQTMNELAGRDLFFKCEIFQRGGAFKFRGAFNSIKKLPETVTDVVTQSSGNHAQALALSAKLCGKKAHIVMPRNAPRCKVLAVEGYGGAVTMCEPTQASREATAAALIETLPNAAMIPPFDYADVMAGQGTVALELLDQVDSLDAIIAPIGGGGLLSGICVAAKARNPSLRVYGAEPAMAADAHESFHRGERTPLAAPTHTIADGLRTQLIGERPFAIIKDHVEEIFLVEESEIIAAMRLLWERMKLVVEPSGAVPLAAVLSPTFRAAVPASVQRIGIVLSGGNQDIDAIPWVNKA